MDLLGWDVLVVQLLKSYYIDIEYLGHKTILKRLKTEVNPLEFVPQDFMQILATFTMCSIIHKS